MRRKQRERKKKFYKRIKALGGVDDWASLSNMS